MGAHKVSGQPAYLVDKSKKLRRIYKYGKGPEGTLYWALKDSLGDRVRLQSPVTHPDGDMIVDILIMKAHLVVEIMDYDPDRDRRLRSLGLDTIWVNRQLVVENVSYVVEMIKDRVSVS